MIKNKKGAEHVDWAISIGIFLIFLLSILVYIKPVYKPTYEAETLGEMVKNSFLAENNRTIYRTLVIIKYKEQISPPCDSIKVDFNSLGNIYVTEENLVNRANEYKKDTNYILFKNSDLKYWVYYNLNEGEGSNIGINSGWTPPNNCLNSEKGETTEYTGLKSTSIKQFKPMDFPDSKQFNLKIRNANSGKVEGYQGIDPPEDVSVYVYEFVYPLLDWDSTTNQPEKTNYIVSIQIW